MFKMHGQMDHIIQWYAHIYEQHYDIISSRRTFLNPLAHVCLAYVIKPEVQGTSIAELLLGENLFIVTYVVDRLAIKKTANSGIGQPPRMI